MIFLVALVYVLGILVAGFNLAVGMILLIDQNPRGLLNILVATVLFATMLGTLPKRRPLP